MAKARIWFTLVLAITVAGCGSEQQNAAPIPAPDAPLTGLYEGGPGPRRNHLCLLEREGRTPSFGFVIWGEGDRSCAARGTARREGNRLRLLPDGDQTCAIAAQIGDGKITFPAESSAECARYYCGDDVAMAGAEFTPSGASEEAARKATDLVGDPLCP